jgi:hypothetical protein
MRTLYITEPKNILEVVPYTVDFSDMLGAGDSIIHSSIIATVSLFNGTDTNPSLMLFGLADITGNVVTQNIQAGIPGNIYELLIQVTTTLGYVYEKVTRIAIAPLPGNAVPQLGIAYLTSQPYPYYYEEQYNCNSITFTSGGLEPINLLYPNYQPEAYNCAGIGFLSGNLIVGNVIYPNYQPEMYNCSSITFASGTLIVGNIVYSNWPAEAYNCPSVAFISGTLVVGNVVYSNYQPEAYNCASISFTSGTLVL